MKLAIKGRSIPQTKRIKTVKIEIENVKTGNKCCNLQKGKKEATKRVVEKEIFGRNQKLNVVK
jgi:hypothetical protein